MRYIRFLKTPRVVSEKGSSKPVINGLITITSDLGDSFFPYNVQLSAEVLLAGSEGETLIVWRTVQWTSGMRTLPISFPLPKQYQKSTLRIRVGVEPKVLHDDYEKLKDEGSHGIVSALSSDFSSSKEAVKLVERRYALADAHILNIWEETGESIARHLWDAGIAISCHVKDLLDDKTKLHKALLPSRPNGKLHVLELGTGCGVVGMSIAQLLPDSDVLLTDLPEAEEIVEINLREAKTVEGSSLRFEAFDWDHELPEDARSSSNHRLDLVLAADCTYNPDSSPILVNTLSRLAAASPNVTIAIAMKMRHSSEEVFFDLMAKAGFQQTSLIEYPLPGDMEVGEETVNLHVYKMVL